MHLLRCALFMPNRRHRRYITEACTRHQLAPPPSRPLHNRTTPPTLYFVGEKPWAGWVGRFPRRQLDLSWFGLTACIAWAESFISPHRAGYRCIRCTRPYQRNARLSWRYVTVCKHFDDLQKEIQKNKKDPSQAGGQILASLIEQSKHEDADGVHYRPSRPRRDHGN